MKTIKLGTFDAKRMVVLEARKKPLRVVDKPLAAPKR
jgi:hypothetical protein